MQDSTYTSKLAGVCAAAAAALALAIPGVSAAAHVTVGGTTSLANARIGSVKVTALNGTAVNGTGTNQLLNVQTAATSGATTTNTAPLVKLRLDDAGTSVVKVNGLLKVKLGDGATSGTSTAAGSTVTLHDDFFTSSASAGN